MQQTFTSRLILGFALTVIVLTLLFTGSAAAWAQPAAFQGATASHPERLSELCQRNQRN